MSTDSNHVSSADLAQLREEMLRRRLAEAGAGRRQEIPLADRDQPLPLSYGQQQMWFLHRLDPQSAEYHVPFAVRLRGTLDAPALRASWQQLVDRHEILRIRYLPADGEPRQVVDAPGAPEWSTLDLSRIPDDEREQRAREAAEADFARPFDLEHRWPLRLQLLKLREDEHMLLATFHHIACDAWSVRLLTGELSALYRAALDGRSAPLPSLRVQYADFAAWQRTHLAGPALDKHLDYWRAKLDGVTPLPLPTDRRRPPVRGWTGRTVHRTLAADLAERVRAVSAAHDEEQQQQGAQLAGGAPPGHRA